MLRQFKLGSREIDLDRSCIVGPEGEIPLTTNEVKVLAVLAAHPGEIFDRDRLLCEALGYRKPVVTRAVDQAVWRLRRKLEPEPHQPRWLRSEANAGYRLVLDPPPQQRIIGRDKEIERLDELLERHRTAVVVGLPGSGRRSVIAAWAARRGAALRSVGAPCGPADLRVVIQEGDRQVVPEPGLRTAIVASAMPRSSHLPVLRIGPLAPADSQALLTSAVLAARGATLLSEAEEQDAAAAAARAGHHPATLEALARRAVLRPLSALEGLPVDDRIARHVATLPPPVLKALSALALFPDAFRPDEAHGMATPEEIEVAWGAGALDAAGSVDRGLVVPPCVRAALTEPVSPAGARAFVEGVLRELEPLAARAIDSGDQEAFEAVAARSARIDAALGAATPEQELRFLPILVVRGTWTRIVPRKIPDPGPEATEDQRTCAALLRAWEAERRDLLEARRLGDQVLTLDPSPRLGAAALRAMFQLRVQSGAYEDQIWPLVERATDLAERDRSPIVSATHVHLRGMAHLRGSRPDAAREDLLAALRLYPPGSAQLHTVRNHLGAEAANDGRVHEALAWVDQTDVHPADEIQHRVRRAMLVLAMGDLEAAQRELELLELLGAPERTVGMLRATTAVFGGRVDEAAVLAESACAQPVVRGGQAFAAVIVLGWVRVVQGLGDTALSLVDTIEATVPLVNADYPAQVALLRVAALARAGRSAEARDRLGALAAPPMRWWPAATRVVAATIDAQEGLPVDPGQLRREVEAGRLLHLVTRFAMAVLDARG